ncbi:MAG TPA: hypothetical protein VF868_13740, partial [Bacteroidia bacterium]
FIHAIKNKLPLKYPFLEYIRDASRIKPYMSALQMREQLQPYSDLIIRWGYLEIAKKCREQNAVPVWAYLLTTTESVNQEEYKQIKAYAESLGFITLDMRDVYGNRERKSIQVSEWNTHPNAEGHRLIAEKFYNELIRNRDKIFKYNIQSK